MQYDAAKGDKNGDGGEYDGRDSPSLMAIGYFESDVAGSNFGLLCRKIAARSLFTRATTSSALAVAAASMAQVKAVACASEKPASFKFSATVRVFVMQHGSLRI
jgi:hypothetical protein